MHVGLRHLETFRLFALTKSVTETARLMRVSQPAISQTLKDIEGQVGFALFVRMGGRTRLTEEAILMMPKVERVLLQMEILKEQARVLRDADAGQLSIASIPSLCAATIPQVIQSLRSERQQLRFSLEALSAQEVISQIKYEHSDIGFAFGPIEESGVASEALLETSIACIVPAGHPLTQKALVKVENLKEYTVIAQGQKNIPGVALKERLDDLTTASSFIQTNYSIATLHLVRHGVGVGLAHPLVMASDLANELVALPFQPDISLTLALVYSRHRPVPRLATRFVGMLREVMKKQAEVFEKRGVPYRVLM